MKVKLNDNITRAWTNMVNMKVMDYDKSAKWIGWTMVDEMNGMDFGLWIQLIWSDGKIM